MKTVPQTLLEHYHNDPGRICIHLLDQHKADRAITYGELIQASANLASGLENAGVKPGEVVIIILEHDFELVQAFFGALLHGAIPSIMPFLSEKLSPEQYNRSLASLLEITRPGGIIVDSAHRSQVTSAMQQNSSACAILDPADFATSSENAIESLSGLKRGMEDIALLQHSSGSTGLQKGVALSHQAIFNQLESYSAAIRLKAKDVIVSWLPLYHDMGLIAGFVMPVLCGVPLVLMSPFDWVRAPARLFQAVTRYKGTLTWLPNFAFNFCAQKIRERDLQGVNLSSWRAVINCSEPMYWESHQMFLERFAAYGLQPSALATSYAMAENVFAVTQGGIDAPIRVELVDRERLSAESHAVPTEDEGRGVRMLSAGQPIDNTLVRIQDDYGDELPDRRVGQIAIQSNCMLSGYYKRPNLSQSAFLDGWYLTGDLGYTVEGELYVTGRIKDLIIVGGKNIYPQDLEYLANNVPGVHPGRVVAFGVFNPRLGTEDVVLIAESETEDLAARAAIADAIRSEITRNSDVALRYVQIVPRGWLLKTSSGKISRGANRQKYLDSFQ